MVRKDGDIHPNGKWVWVSSANGGKGDWRTLNGRTHKNSQTAIKQDAKSVNNKSLITGGKSVATGTKTSAKSVQPKVRVTSKDIDAWLQAKNYTMYTTYAGVKEDGSYDDEMMGFESKKEYNDYLKDFRKEHGYTPDRTLRVIIDICDSKGNNVELPYTGDNITDAKAEMLKEIIPQVEDWKREQSK